MAASAAATAVELQQALADNLARLKSAQNYVVRLRASDDPNAAFDIVETQECIEHLLDIRITLRARL